MTSAHHHVSHKRLRTRKVRPAVWLDGHGMDQIQSVSVPATNKAGHPYDQIPEGQVLAYDTAIGLSYPVAYVTLTAPAAATNQLAVSDVGQLTEGDIVQIDDDYFRVVMAVDDEADTITVDGAALTLDAGTTVEVDASRAQAEVKTTAAAPGAASTTVELLAGHAARFIVGDLALVAGSFVPVTAVDTGADTITVTGDLAVTDGDRVMSSRRGGYELTTETVSIFAHAYIPDNILCPTRPHGRVRESACLGLSPSAKAGMSGLIKFV